jgi:hypothetical protein
MPSRTRTHCPQCNTAYPPRARFCQTCGRKRDQLPDPEQAASPTLAARPAAPTQRTAAPPAPGIGSEILGATTQGFGHLWRGMSAKQRRWSVGIVAVLVLYGIGRTSTPPPPPPRPAARPLAAGVPTGEQPRRQELERIEARKEAEERRQRAAEEKRLEREELAAARRAAQEEERLRAEAELAAAQTTPSQPVYTPVAPVRTSSGGGKRCVGASPCSACTTCSGCRHCAKEGGRCGVCAS